MPKLKSKSGAKKRFSMTATGIVRCGHSNKRHRLISRPKKMKRHARGLKHMQKGDSRLIKLYTPYM